MLRAILERTPDVIYLNDRAGRFTFVDSEAARLLGRDIEEIIGHAPDGFLAPHISGPLRKNDDSILEQNSATIVEERMPVLICWIWWCSGPRKSSLDISD